MIGFADHDPHIERLSSRLHDHRAQTKFRDIHHDWRLRKAVWYPAIALECKLDLLHSNPQRRIECRNRAIADESIRLKAVTTLKMHHGIN